MPRDLAAPDSKLLQWIARKTGATVNDAQLTPLLNGAVLRHWRLDLTLHGGRFDGTKSGVPRAAGVTPLGIGLPRAREFALQRVLHAAGLKIAEPLFMCCDTSV